MNIQSIASQISSAKEIVSTVSIAWKGHLVRLLPLSGFKLACLACMFTCSVAKASAKASYVFDQFVTRTYPDWCNKNLGSKKFAMAILSGSMAVLLNVFFFRTLGFPTKTAELIFCGIGGLLASQMKYKKNPPTPGSKLPPFDEAWSLIASSGNFKDKAVLSLVCKKMNRIVSKEPDHQIVKSMRKIINKKIVKAEELMQLLRGVQGPVNPLEVARLNALIAPIAYKYLEMDDSRMGSIKRNYPLNQAEKTIENLTKIFWFFLKNYDSLDASTQNLTDKFILYNFADTFVENKVAYKFELNAPFPKSFLEKPNHKYLKLILFYLNKSYLSLDQILNKLIDFDLDLSKQPVFQNTDLIKANYQTKYQEVLNDSLLAVLNHPDVIKSLFFIDKYKKL